MYYLQEMRDGPARQHDIATCKMCDPGYVVGAVDVFANLGVLRN